MKKNILLTAAALADDPCRRSAMATRGRRIRTSGRKRRSAERIRPNTRVLRWYAATGKTSTACGTMRSCP